MLNTIRSWLSSESDPTDAPDYKPTLADVLRRDWFELWYQPKIELKTMRLIGAEGLARARHPTKGIIPPGVFLPNATEEDTLALTERVILTALRDWELFAHNGISIKLAVNVPVTAFVKLPLAKMLQEQRPRAEGWPGLIMEVTEDEALHDLKLANDVADALKQYSCTLAIDDFGAGYSSLARLRQLPFSELKIDRSYVQNCHSDKVNSGLCETIVELAKRFGLKTIAEGIETPHEANKLQGIGCYAGQGFLYAKPTPKVELIGTMRRRMMDAGAKVARG